MAVMFLWGHERSDVSSRSLRLECFFEPTRIIKFLGSSRGSGVPLRPQRLQCFFVVSEVHVVMLLRGHSNIPSRPQTGVVSLFFRCRRGRGSDVPSKPQML